MNIASWFTAYRLLASALEEERRAHAETRRKAEEKEQQLTDALMRAVNRQPVYDRPAPEKQSNVPPVAYGPTLSAARQAAREREEQEIILKRAKEARNNGKRVEIPHIPDE